MSTSFPTGYDAFTNPTGTDTQAAVPHADQHANANDAIEAIERRVGTSGTSFPVSPSSGDRFYRTDRKIEYYWDGTRWLSVQLFRVKMNDIASVTASQNELGKVVMPVEAYGGLYVNVDYIAYVVTTNNGSNFWYIPVRYYTNNSASADQIPVSTAGSTASTWTRLPTANTVIPSTATHITYSVAPSGAPGALHMSAVMTYRLVG
jgi:hypothetical protein